MTEDDELDYGRVRSGFVEGGAAVESGIGGRHRDDLQRALVDDCRRRQVTWRVT